MKGPRIAFYADDFTGATDAMESLTNAGVDTVLFMSVPTPDEIETRYGHLGAIGVASLTRSMSVDELDREVPSSLRSLHHLGPSVIHYKVCSTFDSSPDIGSIGRVAEIGFDIFGSSYAFVVVGAPDLGRYVIFGNLFASDGTSVHRLDRHHTMRHHAVTPMTEGDLRLHLGAQTDLPIGHVDLITIKSGIDNTRAAVAEQVADGAKLIVLDTLDAADLRTVGHLIWGPEAGGGTHFVVGSSGVEHALAAGWNTDGHAGASTELLRPLRPVDRIIVISASAALTTARQIEWARHEGWTTIPIDCGDLLDDELVDATTLKTINSAHDAYRAGKSVILFTALGPQDPRLADTRARASELGYDMHSLSREIGHRLGQLLSQLLAETRPERICIAGGDTSGHIVTELGVHSLKMLSATVPGAPLCRVSSDDDQLDGLELVLKGGQTGPIDFFETMRSGRSL